MKGNILINICLHTHLHLKKYLLIWYLFLQCFNTTTTTTKVLFIEISYTHYDKYGIGI